ncbi:MAG: RdgB/HAM1 family non-canonical purine NTP pyrophosphatase [Bacteroidetes bacterium]|nr:RdgB/HAM1 family non-canonical purine NTP pyrophosphatase [Bacteroidota bacterium]
MKLIFATANQHKAIEAQAILGQKVQLILPADLGYTQEIPETGNTLESNAMQKARTIWNIWGMDCFADDTGLEVLALDGAPGVFSARYAGANATMQANLAKLLTQLKGKADRRARFRSVIALILKGTEYLFEGCVSGHILEIPQGDHGFGYDPLFVPQGYGCSFALMSPQEKNAISHRGRALEQLANFLSLR